MTSPGQRTESKAPLLSEGIQTVLSSSSPRSDSPLKSAPVYRQEWYRWVILALFSFASLADGLMWSTLAPVASTLNEQLGISFTYINFYSVVFFVTYFPLNFPINYLVEEKGLRFSLLLALVVTTVGAWIRILFNYSLVLSFIGSTIASFSNPLYVGAPSKLSSRTSATTLAACANMIGGAIGQLIPVWIVKDKSQFRPSQITTLMIVEAIYPSVILILVLILFKSRPTLPPSLAAHQERQSFCRSMKLLLTDCSFLILLLSFFCINGALNNLCTVVEEIFSHYSYSEPTSFSSLINSLNFFVGFIASLGIAALADRTKKLKLITFICALASSAILAAFTWVVQYRLRWLSGLLICLFGAFNVPTIPSLSKQEAKSHIHGLVMSASQLSAVLLSYVSSALFDAASASDTWSPYIVNLMNFGIATLGTLLLLGVKEELKRSNHEHKMSSDADLSRKSVSPSMSPPDH